MAGPLISHRVWCAMACAQLPRAAHRSRAAEACWRERWLRQRCAYTNPLYCPTHPLCRVRYLHEYSLLSCAPTMPCPVPTLRYSLLSYASTMRCPVPTLLPYAYTVQCPVLCYAPRMRCAVREKGLARAGAERSHGRLAASRLGGPPGRS
eukprot:189833-Rhodomonas_salina.1